MYARKAFDATNQAIDALQIIKPNELQMINLGLLIAAIGFGVCMTLSLILSLWRSRLSSHVDDRGEHAAPACMPRLLYLSPLGPRPCFTTQSPQTAWGSISSPSPPTQPPFARAGKASGSSGGYLTLNFLLNCLNWLVIFFVVVLISAFALWGAMTFAVDKGAGAAYNVVGKAQVRNGGAARDALHLPAPADADASGAAPASPSQPLNHPPRPAAHLT